MAKFRSWNGITGIQSISSLAFLCIRIILKLAFSMWWQRWFQLGIKNGIPLTGPTQVLRMTQVIVNMWILCPGPDHGPQGVPSGPHVLRVAQKWFSKGKSERGRSQESWKNTNVLLYMYKTKIKVFKAFPILSYTQNRFFS